MKLSEYPITNGLVQVKTNVMVRRKAELHYERVSYHFFLSASTTMSFQSDNNGEHIDREEEEEQRRR